MESSSSLLEIPNNSSTKLSQFWLATGSTLSQRYCKLIGLYNFEHLHVLLDWSEVIWVWPDASEDLVLKICGVKSEFGHSIPLIPLKTWLILLGAMPKKFNGLMDMNASGDWRGGCGMSGYRTH